MYTVNIMESAFDLSSQMHHSEHRRHIAPLCVLLVYAALTAGFLFLIENSAEMAETQSIGEKVCRRENFT